MAHESAAAVVGRLERLVARNAATGAELEAQRQIRDELRLDVDAIEAKLDARLSEAVRSQLESAVGEAEAGLRETEQQVERLAIRSPADGEVFSLPVVVGQFLEMGQLVARVGSLGGVRARIFVDEPDLGSVEPGDVALISVDAYPGREWRCEVGRPPTEIVELGPRRVGEVMCTTPNPDGRLVPNLSVGVRIVTDEAGQALSLPRSAVLRGPAGSFVWVVDAGRAARRPVETGVEGPLFVEVLRGVGVGETVAIPREGPLIEGQAVTVVPQGASNG